MSGKKPANTVLAVKELEEDQLSRYGVIDPADSGKIMQVIKMVEKTSAGYCTQSFCFLWTLPLHSGFFLRHFA